MAEVSGYQRTRGAFTSPNALVQMDTIRGPDEVKGYVYDEVTPLLMELEIWCGEVVAKQVTKTFVDLVKRKVKQKYKSRNDHTWKRNSWGWFKYKQRNGYDTRAMHMHDTRPADAYNGVPLATTVATFGARIRAVGSGENYAVWGLEDEFENNPYVWFHETGYRLVIGGRHKDYGGTGKTVGSVPARPFIAPAINEAMDQALSSIVVKNPITRRESTRMVSAGRDAMIYSIGTPYSDMQFEMESTRSLTNILALLWYFMPQAEELKYLGYFHDVGGYLSGKFISLDTMKRFARAAAMGKAGQITGVPLTSKLARRTSRKALWGTQSVSIIGGL